MIVVDVDSHFMEPWDWFDRRFPDLAKRLPKYNFARFFAESVAGEALSALPPEARPDFWDLLPEALQTYFRRFGEEPMTGIELAEKMNAIDGNSGRVLGKVWNAPGASGNPAARQAMMDRLGIDKQFINLSIGLVPAIRARDELNDPILARECMAAYNTWAAEQVEGHQDRQIPVCYVTLDDLDWAIAEISRMRELGSRAVLIPAQPVRGMALSHPQLDRFWSACADLGVAVVFHINTAGRVTMHPGWANTGGDWRAAMLHHATQTHQLAEIALGNLIFGGVLERHPTLVVMSQELDIGWLPNWVRKMDSFTSHRFFQYSLPLKPSEYVQRQVFISGLAPADKLQDVFEAAPPDTIVFASDWPHPEGGSIETVREAWTSQLAGLPESRTDSFLGTAIAKALHLN